MNQELADRLFDYRVDFRVKDRNLLAIGIEDYFDLVQEVYGRVVHRTEKKTITVGRVRAERVDVGGAAERGSSVYDVCDGKSQELYDCYAALFNTRTDNFREEFDLRFGDLLVIHEIQISRKHRGINLGLLAMLETIRVFGGGCSAVAIKPFPLQYVNKVNEGNERAFSEDLQKLRDYWCQLGFERAGKTDFFYFNLEWALPAARALATKPGQEVLRQEVR